MEWHQGELFPRVGFIVTNLRYPPQGIVHFNNGRGNNGRGTNGRITAEQWTKEGSPEPPGLAPACRGCHKFVANQLRLTPPPELPPPVSRLVVRDHRFGRLIGRGWFINWTEVCNRSRFAVDCNASCAVKLPRSKGLHKVLRVFDRCETLLRAARVVTEGLGVGVDATLGVPEPSNHLLLPLFVTEDQVLPLLWSLQ